MQLTIKINFKIVDDRDFSEKFYVTGWIEFQPSPADIAKSEFTYEPHGFATKAEAEAFIKRTDHELACDADEIADELLNGNLREWLADAYEFNFNI